MGKGRTGTGMRTMRYAGVMTVLLAPLLVAEISLGLANTIVWGSASSDAHTLCGGLAKYVLGVGILWWCMLFAHACFACSDWGVCGEGGVTLFGFTVGGGVGALSALALGVMSIVGAALLDTHGACHAAAAGSGGAANLWRMALADVIMHLGVLCALVCGGLWVLLQRWVHSWKQHRYPRPLYVIDPPDAIAEGDELGAVVVDPRLTPPAGMAGVGPAVAGAGGPSPAAATAGGGALLAALGTTPTNGSGSTGDVMAYMTGRAVVGTPGSLAPGAADVSSAFGQSPTATAAATTTTTTTTTTPSGGAAR